MLYKVLWEIDIEADTPKRAAEIAREIQLRPDSIATVFDVYPPTYGGKYIIDLTAEEY